MNRLHAHILTGGLILSPVLITANELVRTSADKGYVENESDPVADAASHLQTVADNLTAWHLAAYLNLAFIATWALALLAITVVVARARPVLAAVSGLFGLISVLGVAFHWAFYYLPLAALAQQADRDLAAHALSTLGDDVLLLVALLMFLLGTLLAVLAAMVGLWRARVLPWWGALGMVLWLGYVAIGPEARLAALLNLALLVPFVSVTRQLLQAEDSAPQRQPAPV